MIATPLPHPLSSYLWITPELRGIVAAELLWFVLYTPGAEHFFSHHILISQDLVFLFLGLLWFYHESILFVCRYEVSIMFLCLDLIDSFFSVVIWCMI